MEGVARKESQILYIHLSPACMSRFTHIFEFEVHLPCRDEHLGPQRLRGPIKSDERMFKKSRICMPSTLSDLHPSSINKICPFHIPECPSLDLLEYNPSEVQRLDAGSTCQAGPQAHGSHAHLEGQHACRGQA